MSSNNKTTAAILFPGLFALLGTVAGGVIKGYWDNELAKEKLHSELILKAMESDSAQERLDSLSFMVDVKILNNQEVEEAIRVYVSKNEDNTENVPQISSSANSINVDRTFFKSLPTVDSLRSYFTGADRRRASKSLVELYHADEAGVVDLLLASIVPESHKSHYRINIYIALTLGQIPPNWEGTSRQLEIIKKLLETKDYKRDVTFKLHVDTAIQNFKQI